MQTQRQREGWATDEAAEAAYRALVTRCRVALTVLPPGCAFSHLTAAHLLGLPTSYVMDADTRIHVTRPITSNRVRIPVIIVGDACATVLGAREPLVLACLRRVRPRGKRTLLEAYEEIRVGSASAGETVARLLLVRGGLPEPLLNEPIFASWDAERLLAVGDLVWRIPLPDGRVIKVVGEYQGELFHSSPVQRARDERRADGLGDDDWVVEDIWKGDVGEDAARRGTVERFAAALEVPAEQLRLSEVGWRFLSTHAMDLAVQRQMRRSA